MSEVSGIEVIQTPSVEVKKVEGEVLSSTGEETMAEYAARRNAEMRGEVVEKKEPAAATETTESAAATDESAAATEEETESENAEESATADEADAEFEPEVEIKPKKGKKGIDKRFAELTEEREIAKREAAETKAQLEQLKAEVAASKKAVDEVIIPIVPKVEDDPVPNRDSFDDPDDYGAALAAFTARQEIRKANVAAEEALKARQEETRKAQEVEQQFRVTAQITELHAKFNERVAQAAPDYPDYEEKVTNNEKLTLRNDVFFTIEQSDMAPHLLYHLASHPEEAASLNTMNPVAVAMRLGELQAEIKIARKPKPSKAAEPIKPVGSRSSPERKTPDEMSMEEYAAMRETERQNALASRTKRRSAGH